MFSASSTAAVPGWPGSWALAWILIACTGTNTWFTLLVTLELDRSGGNRRAKAARDQGLERFRIARVAVREADGSEGRSIGKDRLVLRFKTLNSNVLEANDYWLDTGSVLV